VLVEVPNRVQFEPHGPEVIQHGLLGDPKKSSTLGTFELHSLQCSAISGVLTPEPLPLRRELRSRDCSHGVTLTFTPRRASRIVMIGGRSGKRRAVTRETGMTW